MLRSGGSRLHILALWATAGKLGVELELVSYVLLCRTNSFLSELGKAPNTKPSLEVPRIEHVAPRRDKSCPSASSDAQGSPVTAGTAGVPELAGASRGQSGGAHSSLTFALLHEHVGAQKRHELLELSSGDPPVPAGGNSTALFRSVTPPIWLHVFPRKKKKGSTLFLQSLGWSSWISPLVMFCIGWVGGVPHVATEAS